MRGHDSDPPQSQTRHADCRHSEEEAAYACSTVELFRLVGGETQVFADCWLSAFALCGEDCFGVLEGACAESAAEHGYEAKNGAEAFDALCQLLVSV